MDPIGDDRVKGHYLSYTASGLLPIYANHSSAYRYTHIHNVDVDIMHRKLTLTGRMAHNILT